ncbi:LytR C-terminal domain-containing protein [Streptomyces albipurpureus]|uniref:LytR C-terminal domain-containing protein n=1 Tax=Streptomyces albipurpureus TaxID=2897419 RepID=A0ABT0UUS7_9ACTN|nr:LytR C-terminal domain-containing protein [Streptomyces sp. CWNU-1]MCM2391390.1 LytR C-terminal domain-containing protein [Streptomyces sp. CWNU-1]
MSMLTPPGMGGKYRITGDRYPRMRRPRNRRRLVVAAIAAVAALGLAGWGTVQLIDVFTDDGDTRTTAARKTDCKPVPGASARPVVTLKPAQITVNVYNATPRGGLAKAAADELKKRGFTIGKVGNATAAYDKKVLNTGLLLGSPTAVNGSLQVLGTQVKGAMAKADARKTADVDLILGTAFTTLLPKPTADAALAALAKPVPAPSGKC